MQISFAVGGVPSMFRRNPWTGRADLQVGDGIVPLQNPMSLSTHYNVHAKLVWQHSVAGHEVEIVRVRPRFFGGLRPNSFTIVVDGSVVAQVTGK
jgi:hypothetical protein